MVIPRADSSSSNCATAGDISPVSRYDHCPFQIFSELLRADAPFLERRRCCSSNLNDGPVSNQCSCNVSIRQWPRTMK